MKRRRRRINHVVNRAQHFQELWLKNIIQKGRETEFGKKHNLRSCRSYEDFKKNVPVVHYEDIRPDIVRMMNGERNVLWPGKINWYSKSAGTTDDKSKYIPVSREYLFKGHVAGSWDTMAFLYDKIPDATMFAEKSLVVGGSLQTYDKNPDTTIGDISAILIRRMPFIGRPFYTPDFETALLSSWDEKLERIIRISGKENVVMIGGVPTWNIVLFRKMLEYYEKDNLLELWPNLQAYVHGGVSFKPYFKVFEELIPNKDFVYQEIYNASEGFFAVQDRKTAPGMMPLLDNAMFFEFIPAEEWHKKYPRTVPIWEVKKDVNYALLVTNNSGLWRYSPGDTVCFTSVDPWRFEITGRTRHYINAFGEEVIVANTDEALSRTCEETGAIATEYTVAPIYFSGKNRGGHEWLIEFHHLPVDLSTFARILDENLQSLNSDYQAKRYKDMALKQLQLDSVPPGTFEKWLRMNKTMGAQIKIPRLSNDRKVIESVKDYIANLSQT
ncbi:MAG: GH3 auxin-responsive promoter family protein [Saprospiraceae bacterium]|nr:GH3 auxin-responsive promoter family protein [Saprospiraceae bacterium]